MDRPRIVGVYLGAGKSSRMGRNKLELPFGNTCLGSLGMQAALHSKLDWTIAVTRQGDWLQWLAPFSKNRGWSSLRCHEADHGLSASLKAGVNAAIGLGADAVVVMLADQPFVTERLLNRMIEWYVISPDSAFVAVSKMPPILFSKKVFPELLQLQGDRGARELLNGKWEELGIFLSCSEKFFKQDIDTVEEYEFFRG